VGLRVRFMVLILRLPVLLWRQRVGSTHPPCLELWRRGVATTHPPRLRPRIVVTIPPQPPFWHRDRSTRIASLVSPTRGRAATWHVILSGRVGMHCFGILVWTLEAATSSVTLLIASFPAHVR
jgi:hypothetical protein